MDVRSADPVFFCNLSNGDAILEFGFQHLAEFDQFITSPADTLSLFCSALLDR